MSNGIKETLRNCISETTLTLRDFGMKFSPDCKKEQTKENIVSNICNYKKELTDYNLKMAEGLVENYRVFKENYPDNPIFKKEPTETLFTEETMEEKPPQEEVNVMEVLINAASNVTRYMAESAQKEIAALKKDNAALRKDVSGLKDSIAKLLVYAEENKKANDLKVNRYEYLQAELEAGFKIGFDSLKKNLPDEIIRTLANGIKVK